MWCFWVWPTAPSAFRPMSSHWPLLLPLCLSLILVGLEFCFQAYILSREDCKVDGVTFGLWPRTRVHPPPCKEKCVATRSSIQHEWKSHWTSLVYSHYSFYMDKLREWQMSVGCIVTLVMWLIPAMLFFFLEFSYSSESPLLSIDSFSAAAGPKQDLQTATGAWNSPVSFKLLVLPL